jgi:hypothetical protein
MFAENQKDLIIFLIFDIKQLSFCHDVQLKMRIIYLKNR